MVIDEIAQKNKRPIVFYWVFVVIYAFDVLLHILAGYRGWDTVLYFAKNKPNVLGQHPLSWDTLVNQVGLADILPVLGVMAVPISILAFILLLRKANWVIILGSALAIFDLFYRLGTTYVNYAPWPNVADYFNVSIPAALYACLILLAFIVLHKKRTIKLRSQL